MGVALFLIGILAIIAGIVMFIVALVRKSGWGVARSLVVGGGGLILAIVGIVVGVAQQATKPESAAVIEITAPQLYSAYKANQVAADAKYKGVVLNVRGIVDSIGKDILDTPYITLSSGGAYEIWGVQCMFSKEYEAELARLVKGQGVTVQGRCSGYLINVILRDCILVH